MSKTQQQREALKTQAKLFQKSCGPKVQTDRRKKVAASWNASPTDRNWSASQTVLKKLALSPYKVHFKIPRLQVRSSNGLVIKYNKVYQETKINQFRKVYAKS